MPAALNKNNAYSTLAGSLTNSSSSMTVASGHGDRFPVVTGSDWCMVTLQDASNNIEIVKVTARASASDSMNITRAQEGTTARSWSIGDIVELRLTAGTVATVDGTQTLKNKTISGADNTLTNIPGANVTGTVPAATTAGACTGNAATATTAAACSGNAATATNATTAATVSNTVASGAVGTTQSPGDNSTKIATTAYADAAATAAAPSASDTVAGKVELATIAETQTGTDTVRAVTPAGLAGVALGVSQAWQNVTGSRSLGTTYTNSTGRTIAVNVGIGSNAAAWLLQTTVAGIQVGQCIFGAQTAPQSGQAFILVPPGQTYSFNVSAGTGYVQSWFELS